MQDVPPNAATGRRTRTAIAIGIAGVVIVGVVALVLTRRPEAPLGSTATASPDAGNFVPVPLVDPIAWQDVRWTQVQADAELGGPLGQRVDQIVAGGPGFIAVGADAHGQPGAETSFAAIWVSTTGETWDEIELTAGVREGDVAEIGAVASGPSGTVLLGGVCCGEERRAAWFSADGLTWERVPVPADVPETYVADVAAGPDGFVAVGVRAGMMAIWTSADGREWVAVDAERADLRRGTLTSVVRDGRGWLAVGQFDDRPTHDGAVYRSDDLASWQRVADAPPLAGPDEIELFDIIPFDGGYLLVGNLGTHEERVQCEQLLGLGDGRLASAGDRVALSCGWGVKTHWRSNDGENWELLPPFEPRPGQPPLPVGPDGRGLMEFGPTKAGGPGVVTLAYEEAGRNGPNDIRALWTTADGRTWAPVGGAPQFPPGASVSDMVIAGRSVIAVGSFWTVGAVNGEDGRAWIGTILP